MAARYRVTGSVAKFGAGLVLALTPPQAAAREADLRPLRVPTQRGLAAFEVLGTVQFKRGEEVVVLAGEPAKTALEALEAEEANAVRKGGKGRANAAADTAKTRPAAGGEAGAENGGLFPPPPPPPADEGGVDQAGDQGGDQGGDPPPDTPPGADGESKDAP